MSIRVAVVGVGAFGKNHLRVLHESEHATLVAAVDLDPERAAAAAAQYGCLALTSVEELAGRVDAAVVAVPTAAHAAVGIQLMHLGIDVLIEKPVAGTLAEAESLVGAAADHERVLQVGHLERFNPAVEALQKALTIPLFFEVHRLSLFTPRSLDVDVVLDLMIHDIDLILAMTGLLPEEIRAAGISILSKKVDIANVRLAFPGGCIANLTASRVSTEKVRKMRVFQPHEYLSLDYEKQNILGISVGEQQNIGFKPFAITKQEPLVREIDHFLHCVSTRARPLVDGAAATRSLRVALEILAKIEAHGDVVRQTLEGAG